MPPARPRSANSRVGLRARLEEVWLESARSGSPMPGEPALAQRLAVSRPAVREALVRLEERGYIRRRQGADTTVNRRMLDVSARIDEQIDRSELIASTGRRASMVVVESRIDSPSPEEGRAVRGRHRRTGAEDHQSVECRRKAGHPRQRFDRADGLGTHRDRHHQTRSSTSPRSSASVTPSGRLFIRRRPRSHLATRLCSTCLKAARPSPWNSSGSIERARLPTGRLSFIRQTRSSTP